MAGRKKTSTADELVEETQIPARRVLSALTMLQVDGAAREHPGKRFSRWWSWRSERQAEFCPSIISFTRQRRVSYF